MQYHRIKQFYQHQNALYLNKGILATKILLAEDSVEIKHLEATMDESNWSDSTGLFLSKPLAETRGKDLIECNAYDKFGRLEHQLEIKWFTRDRLKSSWTVSDEGERGIVYNHS